MVAPQRAQLPVPPTPSPKPCHCLGKCPSMSPLPIPASSPVALVSPAQAPWPGRLKLQKGQTLTPLLPLGEEEEWWESVMASPKEQKPGESGGDVAWVQLMEQMLLPGSRETPYRCIIQCVCVLSRCLLQREMFAQHRPGNSHTNAAGCPSLCRLRVQSNSSNALSSNTAKCASLHTLSTRPYTCMYMRRALWLSTHPSRPAAAALSPSTIPACAHRCTHQGRTLCSTSPCSATALYFICRGGEVALCVAFKPCF